jgi:hypothetical protein
MQAITVLYNYKHCTMTSTVQIQYCTITVLYNYKYCTMTSSPGNRTWPYFMGSLKTRILDSPCGWPTAGWHPGWLGVGHLQNYHGKGWPLAMDSLKFHLGPPCPTFLRPAGGPPLKQPYSGVAHLQVGRPAAVFSPSGHPTPYAYGNTIPETP